MHFADRLDTTEQLAAALQADRGRHPLILAIPRGAVPIFYAVAQFYRTFGQVEDDEAIRLLGSSGRTTKAVR